MHWRTRFLLNIIQIVASPLLFVKLITWYFSLHFSLPSHVLFALAAITSYIYITSLWSQHVIRREASRLGCRTIPIVKGKWPGNIDLLLQLLNTSQESYAASWMYDFFREYQVNTINIRPLGMDLIMTCDHGAIKEMLAGGGTGNWEKGFSTREAVFDFFGKGIFAVDGDEWKAVRLPQTIQNNESNALAAPCYDAAISQ
jgi:hypothetical protein